jgi:acyl-CoA synthetase (AMP-forming)/AMP-acid ligase II
MHGSFPADMDEPIFPDYPPTLGNAISDSAARYADRVFLAAKDRHLTFADVDAQSLDLASGLLATGVGKASRVAILMGNTPDWVLTWLAAGRIGALTLPGSTLFQSREISWFLKFADVDTLLMDGEFAGNDYIERLERAIPDLRGCDSPDLAVAAVPFLRRIYIWNGPDELPVWARRGPDDLVAAAGRSKSLADHTLAKAAQANVSPADWLIGVCTSGTTAEPKIVIHTHGTAIRTTNAHRAYRGPSLTTRDYAGMPFFWLGGINGHVLPCLYEGARLVFSSSPRVDDILDTVRREGVTRLALFPARRDAVVEAGRAEGLDLSGLEGVAEPRDSNGAVIPPNRRGGMLLGMTETFGPHGVEVGSSVLPESKAGSMGHSLAGIERRIADPETGSELPPGMVGELQIRGFSLMQGYYKRERGDEFTDDGWFRTGDLCHLDEDGYIYFDNRLSDMIKTMGANVAPREVEVLLESLPGVREAIVFGVPDGPRGEAVVAVVVPMNGVAVQPDELRNTIKDEISSYKVPKYIVVASYDDVPRTDAGKPRKHALREVLPVLSARSD